MVVHRHVGDLAVGHGNAHFDVGMHTLARADIHAVGQGGFSHCRNQTHNHHYGQQQAEELPCLLHVLTLLLRWENITFAEIRNRYYRLVDKSMSIIFSQAFPQFFSNVVQKRPNPPKSASQTHCEALNRTTENFYTSSLLCARIASQAAQAGQSQYAAPFA